MSDVEIIGTPERTVTRRKFIMGVIAAGATTSSVGYLFKGPQPLLGALVVQGSVERLITLNVNGQQRRVDVLSQETLAFTLRYKLGLTGTKLGCDRAECGACTVLIDGVNSYSCSVLTHSVRGAQITTIEGLEAADGTLHPVQQAVLDGRDLCSTHHARIETHPIKRAKATAHNQEGMAFTIRMGSTDLSVYCRTPAAG